MPKYNILIARFPYHGDEQATTTDWLVETVLKMKKDPRIGDVQHVKIDDTPVTMSRNRACRYAQKLGADYVLMVDSDMAPDLKGIPGAKPFWDTSWDFVLDHQGPCMVAAPYCGPPPWENVYIFQWGNRQNDEADPVASLNQFGREEAARMAGITEVAALPTGLILIDRRVLDRLPPPWFEYEWMDEYRAEKGSTEDVYFTRNASLAGIPIYCNWDAWAGHWKRKCVGKPRPMGPECVGAELRKALSRPDSDERVIEIPVNGVGFGTPPSRTVKLPPRFNSNPGLCAVTQGVVPGTWSNHHA